MSHDSTRLFGTDGIRGHFGEPPLDRATVTALAVHLAATLRERAPRGNGAPPRVVLGGDTRESTPEICRWLAAGLLAGGVEVRYAGVIPTPGVAYLVRTGAAAGVVVSASHNPYPDNGIKLIDPQGPKWSDEDELALERRLRAERRARAGISRRRNRRSSRSCASAICAISPRRFPASARWPACGWCSTPATAPPRPMPASSSSGSAPASPCSTPSPTAATSTSGAARRRRTRWRRGWSPRGRTSAPPSTATPTAASSPTRRGRCATATPSSISGRPACTGAAVSIRRGSWPPR